MRRGEEEKRRRAEEQKSRRAKKEKNRRAAEQTNTGTVFDFQNSLTLKNVLL